MVAVQNIYEYKMTNNILCPYLGCIHDSRTPPTPACYCLQAPEALLGGTKLTSSLDIYAFGIMMFEVLSGQQAYQGGAMVACENVTPAVLHCICHNHLRPSWPADAPPEYRSGGGGLCQSIM